jgi:hypothetical protein
VRRLDLSNLIERGINTTWEQSDQQVLSTAGEIK